MYKVVTAYLERSNREELIFRMCLLSPYQINCNIVRLAFRKVSPQFCDRERLVNRILKYCVGTVSSCLVMEFNLISFISRRSPMNERPIGSCSDV